VRDIGSLSLNRLIAESEVSTELIYHLASNPEEARRISSLPAESMGREIGRIETRLEGGKVAPPKPIVTNAKPPPSPVVPLPTAARPNKAEQDYPEV